MVNHLSFAGDMEENGATLRCEREGDEGMMFGSVIIEDGVGEYRETNLIRAARSRRGEVAPGKEDSDCVVVRGEWEDDSGHIVITIVNGTELRKRRQSRRC